MPRAIKDTNIPGSDGTNSRSGQLTMATDIFEADSDPRTLYPLKELGLPPTLEVSDITGSRHTLSTPPLGVTPRSWIRQSNPNECLYLHDYEITRSFWRPTRPTPIASVVYHLMRW